MGKLAGSPKSQGGKQVNGASGEGGDVWEVVVQEMLLGLGRVMGVGGEMLHGSGRLHGVQETAWQVQHGLEKLLRGAVHVGKSVNECARAVPTWLRACRIAAWIGEGV